jgi:hypothetical protein
VIPGNQPKRGKRSVAAGALLAEEAMLDPYQQAASRAYDSYEGYEMAAPEEEDGYDDEEYEMDGYEEEDYDGEDWDFMDMDPSDNDTEDGHVYDV